MTRTRVSGVLITRKFTQQKTMTFLLGREKVTCLWTWLEFTWRARGKNDLGLTYLTWVTWHTLHYDCACPKGMPLSSPSSYHCLHSPRRIFNLKKCTTKWFPGCLSKLQPSLQKNYMPSVCYTLSFSMTNTFALNLEPWKIRLGEKYLLFVTRFMLTVTLSAPLGMLTIGQRWWQ